MQNSTSESILTIHMVASLDGFIAKLDGSTSWMETKDHYEKGHVLTSEEIDSFLTGIDCYVMGSKTYELALQLGWPYGDKPVFVVTRRMLPKHKDTVSFYAGELDELIVQQLKPVYMNIWMVGGSMLTKKILRMNLADEVTITLMPILLGNGILFFDYIGKEQPLHLKHTKAYQDGTVELTYEIIK